MLKKSIALLSERWTGRNLFLFICALLFLSCPISILHAGEKMPQKKWDTVNVKLNSYLKKDVAELYSDFGQSSESHEESCTFSSKDASALITFILKNNTVRDYFYTGAYSSLLSIIPDSEKFRLLEMETAVKSWEGIPAKELGKAYDVEIPILQSDEEFMAARNDVTIFQSNKEFTVKNNEACIFFKLSKSTVDGTVYVRKAELNGNTAELKDILRFVPETVPPAKKGKASTEKAIKSATAGTISAVAEKKKLELYFTGNGSSALQYAIQQKNVPAALWMIENEICDVNHYNIYGKTAFNDAIDSFDTEILRALVKHGARIADKSGLPLQDFIIQSVQIGNVKAAGFIKELNFRFDGTDSGGNNLIHVAAENSQAIIIPFLLENGCKIDAENSAGFTPLLIAVSKDEPEMVKSLIKNGADKNKRNKDGITPLLFAIAQDNGNEKYNALKALLDENADIEVQNKNGETPFAFAYKNEKDEVAEILLKNGARFPRTLLIQVLNDKRQSYIPVLLEAGADITATDSSRRTVLHIAAAENDYSSLSLFLKHSGMEKIINAKDSSGNTPVMLACSAGTGFADGVQDLLEAGAVPGGQNSLGYGAIHFAVDKNSDSASKTIAGILLDASPELVNDVAANKMTPLLFAIQSKKIETADYLISRNADVNASNENLVSPLSMAINCQLEELSKTLIKKGADVHAKNSIGNTPLHIAAIRGIDSIVQALVSRGADINAVNSNNETPLGLAAKNNNETVANYLLNLNGINVNIKDKNGKSGRNYLWEIYTKRINESRRRVEEYTRLRQEAWDRIAEVRSEIREEKQKIYELERKNRELERQKSSADSDSSKNSYNISIASNNIAITSCNIVINICNSQISDYDKTAKEYGEKIDAEFKLQNSYIEKEEALNRIPR